jgi:hypothetical protein
MTIKKHSITAAIAIAAALAAPHAMAQFGGLSKLVGGGSSSTSSIDPDAFLASAKTAEKLMINSVTLLSQSLASKEKAAGLKAERAAASAITDPAERQAKLLEVQKNELAAANEATGSAKIEDQIKGMDASRKADLASAAFNFALAFLQDKALMEQSSSLISSISSNPMQLAKLGSIKDVGSSLANQVSAASSIVGKMPKIFSAVGIEAPTSKDAKPKTVAQVSGE